MQEQERFTLARLLLGEMTGDYRWAELMLLKGG